MMNNYNSVSVLKNIEEELKRKNELTEQQNKLMNTQNDLILGILSNGDEDGLKTVTATEKNYWLEDDEEGE